MCRDVNEKSKNKIRNKLAEFKKELGGKCIDCGETELFKLEFDHIDPTLKTVQISRSAPKDWIKDKDNLQLLCRNCHRIKTVIERDSDIIDKNRKIVMDIKREIGGCQICNWTHPDDKLLACAIDFDHIEKTDKYKQISDIKHNLNLTLDEMLKCRAICSCCHNLHTCIQLGGKC